MAVQKAFGKVNFAVVFLILLSAFIVFPRVGCAQNDIIRIDTNLITVPATVLDRDGRYVTNLKKEDFQIFEDGVEQDVAFFEPTDAPFTILFLIDVSSSMSSHKENLSVAVNALSTRLRPNDQIMAAGFFQWTDLLIKQTKVSELTEGIKFKVRSDSDCPGTYLYNAVDDALNRMKKIRGRKAIVLLSDGDGGGFGISAEDTLRKAEEQKAIIYTFKFETDFSNPAADVHTKQYYKITEERRGYMRDLARKTGGRSYLTNEITDVEKTFSSVIKELGEQYTIGYYPKKAPEANQKRQIKVRVNQPNLAVRGRENYIVEASKLKQK